MFYGLYLGACLLACFGLCLLLYYLGEPKQVALGKDAAEFVALYPNLSRLGYLLEVERGGNYTVFIDGVRHDFYLFSVSERIGNALTAALSFNYGQSMRVECSVWALLWPGLLSHGISALVLTGLSLWPCFLRRFSAPKFKAANFALVAGLVLLGLSFVFALWVPKGYYFALALLGFALSSFCLVWMFANPKKNAYGRGLLFAFAGTLLSLLLSGLSQVEASLGYQLYLSFAYGDSHFYAVALFFAGAISSLLLAGFFAGLMPEKQPKAKA